jgi:hypothetical protein
MQLATKVLTVWLLLSSVSFGQGFYDTTTDVTPVESVVLMADSATTYDVGDRVAVVLTKPDPEPVAAATINVVSSAKWVVVKGGKDQFSLVDLPKLDSDHWLLTGSPGEYTVFVSLSGPNGPPEFIWKKVELGKVGPGPVEPVPDDPVSDYKDLVATTKKVVVATGDPVTAKKLAIAYLELANDSSGDLATLLDKAKTKRYEVLLSRKGDSLKADWQTALQAIGDELGKVYKTAEEYKKALRAMAEAMADASNSSSIKAVAPVSVPVVKQVRPRSFRWVQQCNNGVCTWVRVWE